MAYTLTNGNGADTLQSDISDMDCHECCPRWTCVDGECVQDDEAGEFLSLAACTLVCEGGADTIIADCCEDVVRTELYVRTCGYNQLSGANFEGLNGVDLKLILSYYDPDNGAAIWTWDREFLGRAYCPSFTTGRVHGAPIDTADCATATTGLVDCRLVCYGFGSDHFELRQTISIATGGYPIVGDYFDDGSFAGVHFDATVCDPFEGDDTDTAGYTFTANGSAVAIHIRSDTGDMPAC